MIGCLGADLEKVASSASGPCGHFFGNPASLRSFWVKYPVLRMVEEELTMDYWVWINKIWGRRMENRGLRIKSWGLRAMGWGWNNGTLHYPTPTFNSGHQLWQILPFWGNWRKTFVWKFFLDPQKLLVKRIWPEKNLWSEKILGYRNILGPIKLIVKKFWTLKQFLVWKIFWI